MHLNVDPGFDAEFKIALRALERGWVTREGIENAVLAREKAPNLRLLHLLPLSPEQRLLLQAPESGTLPPELAEVACQPGRQFGHYLLGDLLGSSGMSRVYKAWDLKLSRWVALKRLKAVGEERPESYFEREARLAASLSHPHIATIFETGRFGGEGYIAMQFIEGRTLEGWRGHEAIRLAGLIRDAARAVDHANARGIVHRDLKPSNMMVDSEDHLFVLDFGLARPMKGTAGHSATPNAMGTPSYMSPEQARGGPVDGRSDVYGLGATMYHCMTGRAPFTGATIYDVLRRVEEEMPGRPRRLNPRIPADLETITLKCLEKDPGKRFGSANELADDLDRFLNHDTIRARPASAFYRIRRSLAKRKAPVLASFLAALLLGFLGWWTVIGGPRTEQLELREAAMKLWAEARGLAMAGVDPEGIRRRAGAARDAFDRAIAVKEDAPSLVMKSRCLQLEARDDDALKAARRATELDPAHAEARLELAKLLLSKYRESRSTPGYRSSRAVPGSPVTVTFERLAPETSEQRRLRQEAENLLAQGGASPALENLLKGLLAMGREDYQGAAHALAAYTSLENWDARGFHLEGMSRFFFLDFQGAISALDQSLLRVPRGTGYRWRGIARHFQGLHEQALADLTKAIEVDRDDSLAYENRGVVLVRMGRFRDAISDCSKAIEMNPKRAATYVSRGAAKKGAKLFDEALADFSKAIEIDPGYGVAYSHRGTARTDQGDLDGAIADFTRAIELEPTYSPAYSNRGTARCSKGLFDEAIQDYTKAIELDPGSAPNYTNRGTAKSAKGLHDEAIADHDRAIQLEPDLPAAYANRGGARRDKGLLRQGIGDLETALKLAPPDWPNRPQIEKVLRALEQHVLCGEADDLFEGGKYREAIRRYAEVVERWPTSPYAPPSAYNCACGHALLGEKAIALDWLEKAVAVGWKSMDHLENDPDLDSLRDDERFKKVVAKLKGN